MRAPNRSDAELPLGLIGVVAALLLSRRPLGFVAILGAARHDHQEGGDLDRSDRGGTFSGKKCVRSRRRCQQLSFPSDYANGCIHRSRQDTDRSDGVLGSNGLCDHGRFIGRDDSNAGLPTLYVAWFKGTEGLSAPSSSPA